MTVKPDVKYTPEEYLKMEREALYKSEYFDGEIFAMSGASRKHNLITLNVSSGLHQQLRKKKCEAYTNDMRIKISSTGLYTYPDIAVVCSLPQFDDAFSDTLLNPDVIVEVLSPSTEAYDRGAKFRNYRSVPSLSEYLMIHQDTCHVEHFVRQPNGAWLFQEYLTSDDVLKIEAIGCELKLDDIYEKVDLATYENMPVNR
jgi:Uma2 family endonuclease